MLIWIGFVFSVMMLGFGRPQIGLGIIFSTTSHRGHSSIFFMVRDATKNILSSDFLSTKELSISKFKRGFGGFTVPIFRGEKFYDKEYSLKIYTGRIKGYYDWMR